MIAYWVILERHKIKLLNVAAMNREMHFRVIFKWALTFSFQWFFNIPFPHFTFFKFRVLIAKCDTLGNDKRKMWNVVARIRTEFSELSFNMPLTFSLQLFGKILFPGVTYIRLKALIAACFTLESVKKNCLMLQRWTEKRLFRVIFQIGFGIIPTMTRENLISRFKLSRVIWFDSWKYYFGEPQKNCLILQQWTEQNIFRVIFQICIDNITTMIL